jgi:hypothetical protein
MAAPVSAPFVLFIKAFVHQSHRGVSDAHRRNFDRRQLAS